MTVIAMMLMGAYAFDHPRILKSVDGIKITLDKIDPDALSNSIKMRADLFERLGPMSCASRTLPSNGITDTAQISVLFRKNTKA